MSSFSLKIIASDKVFYDGRAEALTIPAMDGQKQILPHHENMVIAVNIGELKFQDMRWYCSSGSCRKRFCRNYE